MCGSLYNTYEFPDLDTFELMRLIQDPASEEGLTAAIQTRPNIRPAEPIPTIIPVSGEAQAVVAQWWLKLHQQKGRWYPDNQWKTFNCKSTKILASPMHRIKPISRRTLVIAEGFHEWQPLYSGNRHFNELTPEEQAAPPTPVAKQCYLIKPQQGLCRFAALSKRWDNDTYSTGIITLPTHPGFTAIHRQSFPLVMAANEVKAWLNPRIPTLTFAPLFETNDFRQDWLAIPVAGPEDNTPTGPVIRLRPQHRKTA